MSDTNRVALRAALEASFGAEIPTPNLEDLCITGAPNLAFVPETTTSEKIRADRQVSDLILVGGEASGDVPSELAVDVHDLLLQGAFFNTFQSRFERLNRDQIQITAVDDVLDEYTVTDEGDAVLVGDIIRARGFTNVENNGFFVVTGVPTNTTIPVLGTLVSETPPENATIRRAGIEAGAGDITATLSPDTITSTVLDFTTLSLQIGDWIKLAGFTTETQNNDFVRVSAIAANVLTFDIVPTGWAAATPAGSVSIYLGRRLVNGVTFRSYFLEEEFSDHTPITFQYFRGMAVDTMSLQASSQSIATLSFGFSGKDAFFSDANVPATEISVDGTGRATGAVTIPILPRDSINTSSDVARISQGGVPITGANFVLEATVEIENNLRQLNAVGFLGAIDIGVGEFSVTGDLNTYFDDADLARDVINNAETSLQLIFDDGDASAIVVDAPRIKFSEGSPEVPSKNEDVTIPLSYQAILDTVKGYTLSWTAIDFQ